MSCSRSTIWKDISNIYDVLVVDRNNSNWDQVVMSLQLLEDWIVKMNCHECNRWTKRWDTVTATGNPISVPVGPQVLWHIFNVLWETIDGWKQIETKENDLFIEILQFLLNLLSNQKFWKQESKLLDLLAPILKWGKVGLFGGAGVGKL